MMLLRKVVRDKRGLSEIVSYVLLIVIVISMSILIYNYMKGFIPRERDICPDGVALIVRSYTCYAGSKTLTLNLQNKGLFTIDAYVLRASESEENEIATKYLNASFNLNAGLKPGFIPLIADDGKGLEPGEEVSQVFLYDQLQTGNLAFVEITPFIVTPDNKTTICGNMRNKVVVNCA